MVKDFHNCCIHTRYWSGNPLFFTSHGVTRHGRRSERIHSFLAKVHFFLFAYIDFLVLRTFEQAANFEVALCPNYLIILRIITLRSSSLRHHYLIKIQINFSDWDSVSNEGLSLLPSSPFIALSCHILVLFHRIACSPFKWPALTLKLCMRICTIQHGVSNGETPTQEAQLYKVCLVHSTTTLARDVLYWHVIAMALVLPPVDQADNVQYYHFITSSSRQYLLLYY